MIGSAPTPLETALLRHGALLPRELGALGIDSDAAGLTAVQTAIGTLHYPRGGRLCGQMLRTGESALNAAYMRLFLGHDGGELAPYLGRLWRDPTRWVPHGGRRYAGRLSGDGGSGRAMRNAFVGARARSPEGEPLVIVTTRPRARLPLPPGCSIKVFTAEEAKSRNG